MYLRLKFGQNEANLLLPLRIQKLKGFQLQGGFAPWPPDQGLCPWTSVIGSRSRARHAAMPRTQVPPNMILWPSPCKNLVLRWRHLYRVPRTVTNVVQGKRSQWWKFTGHPPIRNPGYANGCECSQRHVESRDRRLKRRYVSHFAVIVDCRIQ